MAALEEASGVRSERGCCVLCCGDLEATALGRCDHPVCYRCSTKMRVLCEQRYCAVCREDLRQVVFGKKLSAFATIPLQQLQHEKKYDIYFADGKVYALYRKLLQHECPYCPEQRPFGVFADLEQHMRKQHELFCCKLCAKHLKIFPHERKWYSRKDLARHRIHGDPDNTSHRGHPLCKFCDERYLDNDELLKHLRRDHYFCHFCDADGAQEYYSDYEYLREHFRELHFLCEEGRCSTERFTHAFRSEIDYKAHKTACHSKSRAEARQNRHIDLQFSYAPRHSRRAEGGVGGEDPEEADRFNRQGRGGRPAGRGAQQNRRGSWRYKREEEDRDVAAAVRAAAAAVVARGPEGKTGTEDAGDGARGRREEPRDPDEARGSRRAARTPGEAPGPKETAADGPRDQDDFPALGSASVGPLPGAVQPSSGKLKDEDFPSLSGPGAAQPPPPPPPPGPAPARRPSAFQEEDFPALVSRIRPGKAVSLVASAWSGGSGQKAVRAGPLPGPPPGPSQPPRRLAGGGKGGKKSGRAAAPEEEEEEGPGGGLTVQEVRGAPTMLDVSSLLAAPPALPFTKVGRKKKAGAERPASGSPQPEAGGAGPPPKPPPAAGPEGAAAVVNGHTERPAPGRPLPKEPPGLKKPAGAAPCPLPQEDFPALCAPAPAGRPPPPGFNSVVLLKSPFPPPGLAGPVSKPPPGFAGLPEAPTAVQEPAAGPGPYLVPENFKQRNIQLTQSIREFLQRDEAKFGQFKAHSGQFRQGLLSAAQYYNSCRELLGADLFKIFNELLVLLPDPAKQQELLSAHNAASGRERPAGGGGGGGRARKQRKGAWPAGPLDCCVCPTCKQVLAQGDLGPHAALHTEDPDFPSLRASSKIVG
ncbi:E3 ubiquitin-protein ligase ZNF598 [Tachyglossus aculeatus]|uniref:E3 ubiquitin-protein ligase ZNF598 n=1 Tax=Tachyglossus aculeatus TaxID=9261 RepID=UPI0018F4D3D8|nr:E3 ubiquitin-protein ligase ZNF598 [Tachyglossus aculeatus]